MKSRIPIVRYLLYFIVLPLFLVACNDPIHYPNPTVEAAPDVGTPFVAGTFFPLSDFGYEQKEFFFSGEAHSYINVLPLTSNGEWMVEPNETASYKTRMLVYRPIDPAKFNGTVIVEWLNVTAGLDTAADWVMLHNEILRRGYAWVGISAQYVGVEGGDTALPTPLGRSLPLKSISPARYGSLSHPGDSFSYDIFAQAAQAIRHPLDVAPLGELQVQHMIAMGQSQSATRLMTFVNAFGTRTDLFDGYFIHSRLGNLPDFGGASAPLSQSPQELITTPSVVKVRDDLRVPVMNVQTETDRYVLGAYSSRQPDSHMFRMWEVAGASHADLYQTTVGQSDEGSVDSAKVVVTNSPGFPLQDCPDPVNTAPQHHFVAEAALHALNEWIVDGILPPSAPRLKTNAAGDGYQYDAYGNVLGGVRSPYVDAPIALMSGENSSVQNGSDICFLFGKTEMLDAATLQSLYPDHAAYVVAVTDAARDAVAKGFLMQEDADLIIKAAQAADIPPSS